LVGYTAGNPDRWGWLSSRTGGFGFATATDIDCKMADTAPRTDGIRSNLAGCAHTGLNLAGQLKIRPRSAGGLFLPAV